MQNGAVDLKQGLPPGSPAEASANSKNAKEREAREKELKKVCADFESIFIYSMLRKMRDTVPKSGLLTEMTGKGTYNTMIDQKVAEDLARGGGFGLQKMLFEQIINNNKD